MLLIFYLVKKSDFHFDLPSELIAQTPLPERSASRLLVVDVATRRFIDRRFTDLTEWLQPGDLLIFNDTRVLPARLYGHKSSGGRVEILIERLLSALPSSTMAGARDRALLLLGFALALRSSEAVSLNLAHVKIERDFATISLPHSKTDQAGVGETYKIRRRPAGDALCVVAALQHWIETLKDADQKRRTRVARKVGRAAVGRADTALFRSMSRADTPTARRLDAESVGYLLKAAMRQARAAGVWDAKQDGRVADFGSHSLRAGFVTTAYEKNMPEWQIQKVTRHKSTAVLRSYNRRQGTDKTAAIDEVLGE